MQTKYAADTGVEFYLVCFKITTLLAQQLLGNWFVRIYTWFGQNQLFQDLIQLTLKWFVCSPSFLVIFPLTFE